MNYSQATEPKRSSRDQNKANEWFSFSWRKLSLLCLLLLTFGCASHQSGPSTNSGEQPTRVEQTAPELPLQIDQNLDTTLDQLLKSSEFARGRWGVSVISLKDGKLIFDHNGGQLFTPASNMKVYTTAVALDLLGADYRWRTSVYSQKDPEADGTVQGDLVLYGRGAPDLVASNRGENTNSLEELVKALKARGIKHIKGNVIGDESYFRGDLIGQGWLWNDLQWYFGAEASALTINTNSFDVSVTSSANTNEPPKVTTNDFDGYAQLTNNISTVPRGEQLQLGVQRGVSDNNVVVWGQYPLGARGYGASLAVHRPALWAATIFHRLLRTNGIVVDGVAQSRDSRVAEKSRFDPSTNRELAFITGKSLGEIVKVTNKQSVNLYAELLLRTLGRERTPMLPETTQIGRELGDDEQGVRLIMLWLTRQSINSTGLTIHDGSGLSRLNLITPRVTSQLLAAIARSNSAAVFTESLPIAATDGTLGGRLQRAKGKVRAKTGALTYINALSGYLTTSEGQTYAFSIICNDNTTSSSAIRLIDQLVLTLDNYLDKGSADKKSIPSNAKH